MAGDWHITAAELGKAPAYLELKKGMEALLTGETNLVANLANVSAALFATFGWHWVGFYLVDESTNSLVLGPFQGPVACTRLHRGQGVCAAAWAKMSTVNVPDVEAFPGHVACSSLSRSEIVLPVISEGRVVAVLDIDAKEVATFDQVDERGLEQITSMLATLWPSWK